MNLKSRIFYWYVAFVLVFICLSLIPAPDKASLIKYHLSAADARLLNLTLLIPEAGLWFAAFYGSQRFQRYGQLIHEGKEAPHISRLSRGLLFLALWLPTSAIISTTLRIIATHHPDLKSATVVIGNYLALVFPLLAFVWISRGARGLSDMSNSRPRFGVVNLVILTAIILGVVFCCLIVLNHRTLRTTYHMSPQLVMLTLGIPYTYMWLLGFYALADLQAYSVKLRGILYRRGWQQLIGGLGSVILTSILLQYLTTLTSWITSLSLNGILLLLYGLLFLLAGAFIVLALGAQKLTKIEEV